MNIAILFYTRTGNTQYIANLIKDNCSDHNVDLIRINYNNDKFKSFKFIFNAFINHYKKRDCSIKYKFNKNDYDFIFIGTPVWFSTISIPIKTLLEENDLENKNIALYCTTNSQGIFNTLNKMRNLLPFSSVWATKSFKRPLNSNFTKKEVSIWVESIFEVLKLKL